MTRAVMPIDWKGVERVLVVKLRSIGDTVLATPSLIALKRFAPHAKIDILLERSIAPVLDGFEYVDSILTVGKSAIDRLRMFRHLRSRHYDVAFNLHGGTTAAFFTGATLAPYRFGIASYPYSFLHNRLLPSVTGFWGSYPTHSAEQQLAVVGFAGVPVDDRPKSHLAVTPEASAAIDRRLSERGIHEFALLHPASMFHTKQWPVTNFAKLADFLAKNGLQTVAVAAENELLLLDELSRRTDASVFTFCDLSLPEINALAARAALFVGNDSGIAHIAAAVKTPVVVIFGSSNRSHWGPWTDSPSEMVYNDFPCQPCAGYTCHVFGEPQCILTVSPENVFAAVTRMLEKKAR